MNRPNAALTRFAITAGLLAGCALYSATPAFAEPYKTHSPNNNYDDASQQNAIRARLRRIGPIECAGNQNLRFSNVLVEASEDGITAKDQCRIELIDSHIIGRRHGIRMGGKSTVILRRSYVEGSRSAVRIGTAASLIADNTRFQGDMERLAAQVNYRDRGGNVWNGVFRTTPLSNRPDEPLPQQGNYLQPSGPYTCRGSETLYLDRLDISSSSDGVTVAGNCNVVVRDSRIVSSRIGITVRGRGTVTVENSEVQGAQGAVRLDDSASLTAYRATFRGGLQQGTSAIFHDQGDNQWLNGGIVPPQYQSQQPSSQNGGIVPPQYQTPQNGGIVPPQYQTPQNGGIVPPQYQTPQNGGIVPPHYQSDADPDFPHRGDLRLSGPYQCNGKELLRLEGLRIEARGDGLTVQGDCLVEVIGSHIIAEGYGIVVRGRGTVKIKNSKIKGLRGSVRLSDRAQLKARESLFLGEMERSGSATYHNQGGNEWRAPVRQR